MRVVPRARRIAVVAIGFAAPALACNALTGAADLEVRAVEDGGGSSTDSVTDAGATDPSRDGSDDGDEGPPLTDCGSGGVCVPTTSGWTPVLLLLDGDAALCPATYPTTSNLLSAPQGGAADGCKCDCTPSAVGACDETVTVGTGGGACSLKKPVTFEPDGGCTSLGDNMGGFFFFSFTPDPPDGGVTCASNVTSSFAPPVSVRICGGAPPLAGSCAEGLSCVPRAGNRQVSCVSHAGQVACPEGFPHAYLAGAKMTDTRDCTGCSCETDDDCSAGSLTLYPPGAGCLFGGTPADFGKCSLIATGVESGKYVPSNGCRVQTLPQVTGSLSPDAPQTVCCNH